VGSCEQDDDALSHIVCVCVYMQGVTGGTDQTSGGCSLC
jgi:hypothetical protein